MFHYNRKRKKSTQYGPRLESLEPREMFANGSAIVEFIDPPSELVSDEAVDIRVRYKLTGNSRSGPWKVNSLALFDQDPGFDDKMAEATSLWVNSQDQWHYHTFQNVDLAEFIDGSDDSVELYAQVKIDDKKRNGHDAKDTSPIQYVRAYADLQASDLHLSDYTVVPGQKIWVHFDVANQGLVKSKASETGIMFSSNSFISSGDELLEKEWLWRLGAGDSNSESRRITIPDDAVIGSTYYVGTIVDYDNDNLEGPGEGNNHRATPRAVRIVDPRADLVVDSISLEHVKSDTIVDIASPGQDIKMLAVIGNEGNARAWTFNVDFYWSTVPWGLDERLADNWVFAINSGNHNTERAKFTVADVPSGTYYITVMADSESEVDEADESNNLLTVPIEVYNPNDHRRDVKPGVTIITAGFQGGGTANGSPQAYTIEMAKAILERAYGIGTARGSVFISDPHTGQWVNPNVRFAGDDDGFGNWRENSNDPNDEIVLIYDWSWESNDLDKGWSEAAGDNLFASLADTFEMGDSSLNLLQRPLHFIGASRGTVVNTHAVQRIDHYFPNVSVDHFTTLDPHPARGPFNSIDDYGSNIKKLILPDNVVYADNYYRQDALYELDIDFNGVEVPGAVNLELSEWALGLAGNIIEHADVPTWYLATIATSAERVNDEPVTKRRFADWWISGAGYDSSVEPLSGRALIGYAYSRIGGRTKPMHLMDYSQFTFDTAPASVINGDFEYGDTLVGLENIPGWERHGGGGTGNLNGVGNNYLKLDWHDMHRTSNRIFFAADVTAVKFDWRVQNADDDDVMRLFVGNEMLAEFSLSQGHSDFIRDITVPLTFDHQGFVDKLRFEIINRDGDWGRSGVRIDNVKLQSGSPVVGIAAIDTDDGSTVSNGPDQSIIADVLDLTENPPSTMRSATRDTQDIVFSDPNNDSIQLPALAAANGIMNPWDGYRSVSKPAIKGELPSSSRFANIHDRAIAELFAKLQPSLDF